MKVAMIGLSHPHTEMYLETLDALDAVTQVVLCDSPSPEARGRPAARDWPKVVDPVTDLETVLGASEISHAIVALPTDQCADTLVRLIEAGKNVFVEKPTARSAAEFQHVLAALDRHPVAFAVAYLTRWHPAITQMRDLYRQQAIGRLTSVELRMVTTQVRLRNPEHWLFQKEIAGGGILSWLGCHLLDLCRYVTGDEFARVSAQLATTSREPITVEDTAAVTFRLSSGAIGTLHAGYLLAQGAPGYRGAGYDRAVHFRGTQGALTYRFDETLVLDSIAPIWGRAASRTFTYVLPTARGYGGAHGVDFVHDWLTAAPPEMTPAGPVDALRVLEVLDAIYEADRAGVATEVLKRPLAVGATA